MFFRRRLFPVFFIGLFGLMMLGSIRSSAYRSGYFNGFSAAQTTVQAEEGVATAAPAVPYGYSSHTVFGGFFRILFAFFFLNLLFKMFSGVVGTAVTITTIVSNGKSGSLVRAAHATLVMNGVRKRKRPMKRPVPGLISYLRIYKRSSL